MNIQRREFLAGVAILPLPFGREFRFMTALRRAIRLKQREGAFSAAEGAQFEAALGQRVNYNGRSRQIARHIRDEVDPPWWRNIFDWILENWEVILKVLLTLVALI